MARANQCTDYLTGTQAGKHDEKKKTDGYRERDELKRHAFRRLLATVGLEQLVFAGESGMGQRDDYPYGYSPKGERLYALKSGQRHTRINMIAAYRNGHRLAPFTIEGACNRTVFETCLETCLIPTLKPGQKLIIDNATFHKGGRIEALVKPQVARFGTCRLTHLTSTRLSTVGLG